MKQLSKAILLGLVAVLLASMPVLAAVAYRAAYTIVESGGTAYTMLPTSVLVDNQWLADNGFIEADALDTRIETLGGLIRPHMVATNKTLTSVAVPANSQTNLYFTTANSDLASLDIITGSDGYITIDDDDTLELGSDFEIEQLGYVDTDVGADKNLVYKEDAFRTYIDGATNITTNFGFPQVEAVNGGNNIVAGPNHTVPLPAGIVAGDLLLVFFAADITGVTPLITFPNEGVDWIQLFETEVAGAVNFAVAYRIADGGEGANIVVTTSQNDCSAYTTYRISGYSGVPEVPAAATGSSANPNPPSLTPSWGASDTLWFACQGNDHLDQVTVYPTDYTDGRNDWGNHANGCGVGTARRELNAVSEDPGTFTLAAGEEWVANTIAIRPVEITATGIASGEHTVRVTIELR